MYAGGQQRGTKHSTSFYLSRRQFNSKPEEDVICMEGFLGPGPGDNNVFVQNVKVAADKIKDQFDINLLKPKFEKDIRPLLASHCLILPHTMDHMSDNLFGCASS